MTITRLKRKNLRSLWELPRRLSRRRGFGIHSPFAFDFVRRVIAQPCHYYCYPELNRLARADGLDPRQLRLLFRVALHAKSDRHFLACSSADAVVKALQLAHTPSPSDTILAVTDRYMQPDDWDEVNRLALGNCILVAMNMNDPDYANQIHGLWQSLPHGMLFYGSNCAIVVSYSHLPHQKFNVWM